MIKQIGTKLYYCILTGNVIKIIGDMQGYVKETTFEEDYQIYTELNDRYINTIDVLKYEYGAYTKISEGATGVSVDLENKVAIFTYDEIPQPPQEPSLSDIVEDQGNKISILEAEKKALQESQDIQDRTIVESDMRMMDLEFVLEDLIASINPNNINKNVEVFTMKLFDKSLERSSVYFNQLKQMIERGNYDSKEEMERILNKYASGTRPRITLEEYDQLFDMLYPPVYDITTESEEA